MPREAYTEPIGHAHSIPSTRDSLGDGAPASTRNTEARRLQRALAVLSLCALVLVIAGPAQVSGRENVPPGRPANLTGTVAHDAVTLTWDAPTGSTVTGYQILRRDTAMHGVGDFQVHVADTGSTDTAYTDTDVEAGARYVYRVKARNGDALSGQSNYFNANLPAAPEPPARPAGLTGTVKHDRVSLTWDDLEDASITGYQVLRRNRDTHASGDFDIHVEDTGSADTAYTDTDVEYDAQYVYRIKARNAAGLSSRSGYFDANIPQPPQVAASFEEGAYTVDEGDSVTIAVVLDQDPDRNVTIEIVPANQGGAQDTDYSGVPQEVVFAKGETRKEFTFTAADDEEDDDGESVRLGFGTLPHRVSAGSANETTVSITDNDTAPADPDATRDGAIDLGDITAVTKTRYPLYSLNKDGDAVDYFRFIITEPRFVTMGIRQLDREASITIENADGEAIRSNSQADAEHVMTYSNYLEGTYYVRVEATEDGTNDYRLAHKTRNPNPDRVKELRQINGEAETPAVEVSFGQAEYTLQKGGSVTVTVVLSADPERAVTIPIIKTNHVGTPDRNLIAVPQQVIFTSGETRKEFTVTATDDDYDDDEESVRVSLGTLPDRVSAGTINETMVRINDGNKSLNSLPTTLAPARFASPVMADPNSRIIWEAVLVPGEGRDTTPALTGYDSVSGLGATLSSDSFVLDEIEYRVRLLTHDGNGLYLVLDKAPSWDFVLRIGNSQYVGSESSLPALHGVAAYYWPTTRRDWIVGVRAGVSLAFNGIPLPSYRMESPLTASIRELPRFHDGLSDFTFKLRFSDDTSMTVPGISQAIFVGGGALAGVEAVDNQGRIWSITVRPHSDSEVTIVVPATTTCESYGAVCTQDGKFLSNRLETIVNGPTIDTELPNLQEPLTAKFIGMPTHQNGRDLFEFYIAFSESITNGHKELRQYSIRVTGGRTISSSRVDQRSDLWRVVIQPVSSNGVRNVSILIPSASQCEVASAICSASGKPLSNNLEQTVPAGPEYFTNVPVYFTFDDGPHPTYTPQVLDVLARFGVRATFFVEGQYVIENLDLIKRMVSEGHTVGNHTWEHESLAGLSLDGFNETVLRTKEALGEHAAPCLRPPYGETDLFTSHRADALGMRVVMWTVDPKSSATQDPDILVSKMVGNITNGSVVLLHDPAGYQAVQALEQTLTILSERGYRYEPVCPYSSAQTGQYNAATGMPTIAGLAQVGETLTANTSGIADDDGLQNASFIYQWMRSYGHTYEDLPGETLPSYTIDDDDAGRTLRVRVKFLDDAGNEESLTSAPTTAVMARPNRAATGAPTINGTPLEVGETLTADTSDIADDDGLDDVSYVYQWVSGDGTSDTDIAGAAGSTYTLDLADEGKRVKVRVSFADDMGNFEELTSAETVPVEAASGGSLVWSATMTAAPVYVDHGYSDFEGFRNGSLTAKTFDLDDAMYAVKVIEASGWFYIGFDKEIPVAFTLDVGGTRLDSSDASFESYSYAKIFRWQNVGIDWDDGVTVWLAMYSADADSD